MIHIYTDASMNNDSPNIIGGVGIVIIYFDLYGNVIREEFFSKRYTKKDILKLMPYQFESLSLKNTVLEFLAVLESFKHINVKEEEIHLFTDWHVIPTIIESEHKCKNIFFHSPNIRSLYFEFKKTSKYKDNAIFGYCVKGHNKNYYNVIADILATYWLEPHKALDYIMKCYDIDNLIELKINLSFMKRRKNKRLLTQNVL